MFIPINFLLILFEYSVHSVFSFFSLNHVVLRSFILFYVSTLSISIFFFLYNFEENIVYQRSTSMIINQLALLKQCTFSFLEKHIFLSLLSCRSSSTRIRQPILDPFQAFLIYASFSRFSSFFSDILTRVLFIDEGF